MDTQGREAEINRYLFQTNIKLINQCRLSASSKKPIPFLTGNNDDPPQMLDMNSVLTGGGKDIVYAMTFVPVPDWWRKSPDYGAHVYYKTRTFIVNASRNPQIGDLALYKFVGGAFRFSKYIVPELSVGFPLVGVLTKTMMQIFFDEKNN